MNQDHKKSLWAAPELGGRARPGRRDAEEVAVELTLNLRKSVTVDWAKPETVRAKLRVMVKTLLRRYKYPPDWQEGNGDSAAAGGVAVGGAGRFMTA